MAAKQPLDSVLSTPTISPEYETMCECCPKLVTLIQQSPSRIGNALFARNFLAPNVRNFVNDRMVSETEKAQRLVDTMTDRIQHYPNSFNDFIDVLEKEGPWTNDMVKELRDLYKAKTVCVVEGEQLSDDESDEDSFHSASELDELHSVCRVSLAPKSIAVPSTGVASATTKTHTESPDDDVGTQTSDNGHPDSSQATSSAAGFVCPFCKVCTVEEFFSKNGCPKAVSYAAEQQPMFPYLDTKTLSKQDREELEAKLIRDTSDMIKLFARFKSSVIKSLESQTLDMKKVIDFVLSLGKFVADIGRKCLANDDEAKIRQAESIIDVFASLRPYISFFNYEIVEMLVIEYETPENSEKLKHYVAAFDRFCKRSVFQVPPNVFCNTSKHSDNRVFSVKYVTETITTLGEVVAVRRKVAEILGIRIWALQLCSIEEGCVCLQFWIPSRVADYVLPVSQSQQAALSDIGVRILDQVEDTGEEQSEKPRLSQANRSSLLHIPSPRPSQEAAQPPHPLASAQERNPPSSSLEGKAQPPSSMSHEGKNPPLLSFKNGKTPPPLASTQEGKTPPPLLSSLEGAPPFPSSSSQEGKHPQLSLKEIGVRDLEQDKQLDDQLRFSRGSTQSTVIHSPTSREQQLLPSQEENPPLPSSSSLEGKPPPPSSCSEEGQPPPSSATSQVGKTTQLSPIDKWNLGKQPQQNLPGKFQMKSKKDDRTLVRSENKNQKPPAEIERKIEIDRSGLRLLIMSEKSSGSQQTTSKKIALECVVCHSPTPEAQSPSVCLKCKHSENPDFEEDLIDLFPALPHMNLEPVEDLPTCTICKTIQLISDPKSCCNKYCGKPIRRYRLPQQVSQEQQREDSTVTVKVDQQQSQPEASTSSEKIEHNKSFTKVGPAPTSHFVFGPPRQYESRQPELSGPSVTTDHSLLRDSLHQQNQEPLLPKSTTSTNQTPLLTGSTSCAEDAQESSSMSKQTTGKDTNNKDCSSQPSTPVEELDRRSDKGQGDDDKGNTGSESYASVASTGRTANKNSQSAKTVSSNEHHRQVHSAGGSGAALGSDPTSDSLPMRGLEATGNDRIALTFHVIVPVACWEWDSESRIHIRFGHNELGNWRDCGEFTSRDLGDGLHEMTCTFPGFKTAILRSYEGVSYKYAVYSPTTQNPSDHFEYLHSYGDYDRCLKVPQEKQSMLYTGDHEYHQYDTFAYPKKTNTPKSLSENIQEKGILKGLWGYAKSVATRSTEDGFNPVVSKEEMGEICLRAYLKQYEVKLCNGTLTTVSDVHKTVMEIAHVVDSLQTCWVRKIKARESPEKKDLNHHLLKETFKNWLEAIVDHLEKHPLQDHGKQTILVLCIIYAIGKVYGQFRNLKFKFVVSLANCHRAASTGEYLDYESLLSYPSSIEIKRSMASHLCSYCSRLSSTKSDCELWFRMLPLYHFLGGKFEPNSDIEKDPNSIPWEGDCDTGMKTIRTKMSAKERQPMKDLVHKLDRTFSLDPGVLYTFISSSCEDDFPALCEFIHPYLTMAWLSQCAKTMPRLAYNQADQWVDTIRCVKRSCFNPAQHKSQYLSSLLQASLLLCETVCCRLTDCTENSVKVIAEAVLSVLCSLDILASSKGAQQEVMDKGLSSLSSILHQWITNNRVIGGSVFGYRIPSYKRLTFDWKGEKELKVWQSLLSLVGRGNPPLHVRNFFEIVRGMVDKRINTADSPKIKIELVFLIEKVPNIHPVLEDVVMEAALKAVETFHDQPHGGYSEELGKLAAVESERVGKLLGRLLEKHLQAEAVTIHDLLTWRMWPKFIKIHECQPNVKKGLPEMCVQACATARDRLQSLLSSVQSGEISISTLREVDSYQEQMEGLCSALLAQQGESMSTLSAVKGAITKRIAEYNYFIKDRDRLLHLCHSIASDIENRKEVIIMGLRELMNDLNRDFEKVPICALCIRDPDLGNDLVVKCFPSAGTLRNFSSNFKVLNKSHHTDLFSRAWRKNLLSAIRETPDFSVQHIISQVWQPTFDYFITLLDSLVSLKIKLSDVDKIFKEHEKTLKTQLENLLLGLKKCQVNTGHRQINIPLSRIQQYWHLCRYRHGADVFLELKKVLNLQKGDFRIVETFSRDVKSSLRDQTLEDINSSLTDAGSFLEDIFSDRGKEDCLRTFLRCQDLVTWLRDTIGDVNEIQGFVTVALATAAGGEGDLVHDKLSHLRTVGSGFASFIYNIKDTDGFSELKEKCASVWEALKSNHKLPKLLLECSNELQWYIGVKKAQGSVETTSYGQMRNILNYGRYKVGSSSVKTAHSIHDFISVSLSNKEKTLPKTLFSLDELRDLESKLVLICGNKADARAEVDHYLNVLHSATRIAELFLELQQAGEVQYSTAVVKFRCAVYNTGDGQVQFNENKGKEHVSSLQDYIKSLEVKLRSWKENVQTARNDYYELNYFTTLQLLNLRKELGLLIGSASIHANSVKPSVLMLLHSVSPGVTSCVVQRSVQIATCEDIAVSTTAESMSEDDLDEAIPLVGQAQPIAIRGVEEDGDYNLNETSLQPVHDIPTSSDTSVSPISMKVAQISFTVDDLSDEQHEIFTHCVTFLGHSERHVLTAFRSSKPDANMYDIEQWCDENEDHSIEDDPRPYPVPELDFEEDETMHLSDDEPDQEEDVDPSHSVSPSDPLQVPEDPGDIPKFKPVIKQIVNEFHPDVQTLLEAGYDLEPSIQAIDHFGDIEAAMNYLDSRDEDSNEGDLLQLIGSEDMEGTEDTWEKPTDQLCLEELCDYTASKIHLTLDQLGCVLRSISKQLPDAVTLQRTFSRNLLKCGHPNLLVTSPSDVLRTVLALYITDKDHTLPTHEEVLVCNPQTTAEEMNLLWRRAISDPDFKRIFCLAHAERLSYQVCDTALRSLSELSQGKHGYRLVIVCSKEDEEKSHIISKLHLYRRPVVPKLVDSECVEYLKSHFVQQPDVNCSEQVIAGDAVNASVVDPDNSCVRVVSSTRSGMGKSLYIQRRADELKQNLLSTNPVHVTIPIHGPVATSDIVLEFLRQHMDRGNCTIYHLDIAPSILLEMDCILFSLLILKGICDSKGHVWRCHPNHLYVVEVTLPEDVNENQHNQALNLLTLLPTVHCISPRTAISPSRSQEMVRVGMDEIEFRGATFQRVYQYLRRHTAGQNLGTFSYIPDSVEGDFADFLTIVLSNCGIKDPSWAEIHHFTKFLDIQLNSCEQSVFCNEVLVEGILSGLKGFVVKFMIRMSQDFSTPSLEGVMARENLKKKEDDDEDDDQLSQYQIVLRREWEQSSHPYIFFNQDGASITFVGFMVTPNGDLIDPSNRGIIEAAIMKPQLYTGLKQNKVNFDEDYRGWNKPLMIKKIATVMGIEFVYDPDETYVLTSDNLIKILAIQMRFRCDIPVVIMGETGCGKTRLIKYMCDLARQGQDVKNMHILKIHGGITDKDVTDFVTQAEEEAVKNRASGMDTVVFFDEANTTDSIGLIKEIMCDRRLKGKPISRDLKFIAACNPYRKHTEEMIEKLETAGLGFYVRETQQKLGKIPLRQLVYRVLDLPPSMRPLVYDFGQLNTETESDYTSQIVKDHVTKHPKLSAEQPNIIRAIGIVLAASQKYMRDQKNECSFVSLRDVERAMIVFEYFYERMNLFAPLIDKKASEELRDVHGVESDEEVGAVLAPPPVHTSNITRALVLSLSVCYHARLHNREPYEELISGHFGNPLALPGGAGQFRNEIRWCQEGLLDNMTLGPNIAKNAALRENVFMMAICIELRIPLFLVGKPGSSKSLAKSIIQDSMHGQGSQKKLLREFKQVHMFSYQCSQLSTPESVIDVFKTAKDFQKHQDTTQYVSVVVLDEVGLAEDSPSLPLKALHPLLEDGTEGAGKDHQQKTVEREKRVAFIGISNWALDPAKMNRGVMVTRGNPGLEELKLSARGICSNKDKDPVRERLQHYFEPLSQAYMEICKKQKRQFFGLRDYYSLIKMLYWMCEKAEGHPLYGPQLEHAIRRNFGGLESDELNPFLEFQKAYGSIDRQPDFSGVPEEMLPVVNPDCSRLGLIKTSLNAKDTTWHGENRYLLFLTENYAALSILEHYLNVGNESLQDSNDEDELNSKPYILFGSSFPKDKEYTQVCRNINQIKICMETGRTVILLNLENLYESLYDVLNQYYMYYSGVRYVDLGLQTHRVKCRVHDNFKLILIAEKTTVYEKFPTPLINRLEKHFVLTSSVLEDWQEEVLEIFEEWVRVFSHTKDGRGNSFKEAHAFIGYQKDTPAAVVLEATNQLKRLVRDDSSALLDRQKLQKVFRLSQYLLLQTAADDALIRLKHSSLSEVDVEHFRNVYYQEQHHQSIFDFLEYSMSQNGIHSSELFMQVTTHSPLLTHGEVEEISEAVSMKNIRFDLHEFDTELDFTNKIGPVFLRDDSEAKPWLVIIQCDSGHQNYDLISCARYRIYDEAVRSKNQNRIRGRDDSTHILFVIRLPQQEVKSQFVGFQGDPWISVHIDDLRKSTEETVIPEQAMTATISELFVGKIEETLNFDQEMPETTDDRSLMGESDSDPEEEMPTEPINRLQETESDMSDSDQMEINDQDSLQLESLEHSENLVGEASFMQHTSPEHVYKDSAVVSSVQTLSVNTDEIGLSAQTELPTTFVTEGVINLQAGSMPDNVPCEQNKAEVGKGITPSSSLEPVTHEPLSTLIEGQQDRDDSMQCTDALSPNITDLSITLTPLTEYSESMSDSDVNMLGDNNGVAESIDQSLQLRNIPDEEPMVMPEPAPFDVEELVHNKETDIAIFRSEDSNEVPSGMKRQSSFHPQHRRLLGCIQAAVSTLKDPEKDRAMPRIQKLMSLIPKNPPTSLDDKSFYAILVKFIHRALKQREEARVDEKDWVVDEAMNARKLQNGGTFRNVLARRIDEAITPFFAKVIACIVQNCNLDLLAEPRQQTSSLSQFWLAMFKLIRIDFTESVAKGRMTLFIKTDFHCQFPFSWIVKEAVDAQWGTDMKVSYIEDGILESFIEAELGQVLDEVAEEDCEQFYGFYLQDFVRYVHKSSHRDKLGDMEYKLIADTLDAMTGAPELCSVDGHESLIRKIIALHLVYRQCRSEVLQFGQLVLHRPGILKSLSDMSLSDRAGLEFTLHLCAVEKVLESPVEKDMTSQDLAGLKPPLKKNEPVQNLQRWLSHVRLSQNVIDLVLSSNVQCDIAIKSRLTWQRIRAVQMFVEHVFLPHSDVDGMLFFPRRLDIHLEKKSDFLKKDTLEAVKLLLNRMVTGKTLKVDGKRKNEIKTSCDRFFIEVVSSLCFGGKVAPEPDLIKVLMDTIFLEKETSELTPYVHQEPDKTPIIRSFLLQLLLEHDPQQVRQYLEVYFERSQQVIGGSDIDQGLCLICIQCFEDVLYKEVSALPVGDQINCAVRSLDEGYSTLQAFSLCAVQVSLEYLEAVAKIRFALSVVAEELSNNRVRGREELLQVASTMCTDVNVNVLDSSGRKDTTGPVIYLLKLLVRQFGFACLKSVSEEHPWVIPRELRRGDNEEKAIDPFVIYGQPYTQLRDAINTALYTKDVDDLTGLIQDNTDTALLVIALYQQVTLIRSSLVPAKQFQPEALQNLNHFIQDCKLLTPDMMQTARLLLANQQGGPLAQMTVSPQQPSQCRSLSSIVVHTSAVMLCSQAVEILLPFVNMFNNPAALVDAYLPTMQEDLLQEVKKAGGGTYYECPKGHPYLVGECGKPVEERTCRECGLPIGGTNHTLLFSNKGARTNDTTKTGHDLGDPKQRPLTVERERHLSAPAVCIVRAIMHSSFIWASCTNNDISADLAELVKGNVMPRHLPEFFWRHLERDIESLRRITNRGLDECAMIVHLVLERILSVNPPTSPTIQYSNGLNSKLARQEWECVFNESYIEPVLQTLDYSVTKALDLIANDDKQEHDLLFYLAYERIKVNERCLEPHLWTYRSRITVDHLRNSVRGEKTVKILDAFLQAEPNLCATQYLPDIVKLQQFLFDTFHRQLEKHKAETLTVRDFLKGITNDNTRNECRGLIDNLKKAWALVGQKLAHHSRLPVEEGCLMPEFTNNTAIEYLIPTTMGKGRCTTSLVDFLVLTHNNFIETCRSLVSSGSSSAVWMEHKVPITHIHRCHLLDYEHQLQSIILSHCHYSLTVGKGQDIKYDLPALEKQILNRFIYGKPMILLDIPHVAYRKDVYTAETFLAIRQNQPQEIIPRQVQRDIITELRTPDQLRETLDVVDIVVGLLSSGGGSSKSPLQRYIDAHKMKKKPFSLKAKEYCSLGHVISLWETISVELARQLWLARQEPFESIPETYTRGLTVLDGVSQVTELDKCLRTFDLGLLLGSLFEFIEVHVKHSTAKEEEWALVEAMEVYRDQTEQKQLPQFSNEFPKSITVDQAVATWKHIVLYQEKLKHNTLLSV